MANNNITKSEKEQALPPGFHHNILKQLGTAMEGRLGKQTLGQTPRGGALFKRETQQKEVGFA